MPKRKPTTAWLAYRIAGAKAQKLGVVHGEDEKAALQEAYREFDANSETERKRIILRSE